MIYVCMYVRVRTWHGVEALREAVRVPEELQHVPRVRREAHLSR